MKTMKIFAMAILASTFGACSSEEPEPTTVNVESPEPAQESNEDEGSDLNFSIEADENGNVSGGLSGDIELNGKDDKDDK